MLLPQGELLVCEPAAVPALVPDDGTARVVLDPLSEAALMGRGSRDGHTHEKDKPLESQRGKCFVVPGTGMTCGLTVCYTWDSC